ncbi:hypothetical protein [Streptomyces carminius]|uniref:hypothetical protein n=1 Tax=Streptomyces carminius TaxID=2665496 RepID=UPI0013040767|nr:hypothetical protein [Streptomyces carminius]
MRAEAVADDRTHRVDVRLGRVHEEAGPGDGRRVLVTAARRRAGRLRAVPTRAVR